MTTWEIYAKITTLTGRPSSLASELQAAIPNRLQELYHVILNCKSKGTAEPWFADLVVKILLSVNRVCGDLLKTIDQDVVSGAA